MAPAARPLEPVWLMQPIPYFGERLRGRWVWEPKIDGWRLQILRDAVHGVRLFGRRLERHPDWTARLPALRDAAARLLPEGTLLDAELTSSRGRRFIPSLFAAHPRAEPRIVLFDVVYHRGELVAGRPLAERKRILGALPVRPPFSVVAARPLGSISAALSEAIAAGHEGIVLKRLGSRYQVGQEGALATADWRKLK